MGRDDDSLLIYAPVALHRGPDGGWLLEDQACNGLRLWAANFARLLVLLPESPRPPPPSWVPVARVGPALERIEFRTLPEAWGPVRFLRALPAGRRTIRAAIPRARYLSFAIGGLFGDWGAVACAEARRLGRPHAVWTDRVESAVTRALARDPSVPLRTRLRARLTAGPMARLERRTIAGAAVGLFHGAETHAAYAPFARAAEIVHDVHIARADHIAPEALAAKRAAAAAAGPLEIVYAGRAEAMKGANDWVAVLERLAAAGVDFRARWIGSGSLLPAMQARVAAAGLGARVAFPGHTADRGALFAALRAAHLLLFCHLTPESPRILIEALVSGTPIAGYDGAFAREITAAHGGGLLVPRGDVAALARAVAALAADRARLADLVARAAADGAPFEDEAVFRHRSALIRRHLG